MAKKEEYGTTVEFVGGNNEYRIGANSILIEHKEKNKETRRIMLDVGAMFPPDWVSYDAAIADMSKYFENPYGKATEPVDALCITHCHEDHIGALVYLAAAKFKLPKIYTSEYSKDFILDQMHKNNIPEDAIPEIVSVKQGQTIEIADNLKISPFNVSHSTAGPLGFHILTTMSGQNNAGLVFTGDYHLGKVAFGKGFDEEEYKEFIADKFVSHIFTDATSATMSSDSVITFDKAVENTVRELNKHSSKQVFSAVIARSVQNLAIDLKAAKETKRTVLIASAGLRQSYEILRARLQENDAKLLQVFGIKEGEDFHIDELVHVAQNSGDIEKYLKKYEPKERYIIISGAFAEDKANRKSCLVLISEQNKVSYDANGKVKGKGMSGHPIFTADSETLFMLRQRPIESINGDKHRALVSRLQALGSSVVLNGTTKDEKYQRSGHANSEESKKFRDLTVQNCKNAASLASQEQKVYLISIHGDVEQLKELKNLFQEDGYETLLCLNTDKIKIENTNTTQIEGQPFDNQTWIAVEAHSISGHGANDVFIFDLCDKNFTKIDNLYAVVNINTRANPHAKKENNFHLSRALAEAEKLEEEGMSMSNIAIRNQIRGDMRGRITEDYSYSQIKALREEKSKSKHKKRFTRKERGGR